jgi:DNA-3-methyladenine glycosylase II
LERLAEFGFGHRAANRFDGTMRMAFLGDDLKTSIGVAITQSADQSLDCHIQHNKPNASETDFQNMSAQIKRILSLDHDGNAFLDVGEKDPVIAQLQALAPGLRPPLFHSPYEAAAWSIISARRSAAQMTRVRENLCGQFGVPFTIGKDQMASFPTPSRLLEVATFSGLDATKIERLHGVAHAAQQGLLNVARLHALGPEEATRELQSIKGIGPFYASLIVIRASGFADAPAIEEPHALAAAGHLYAKGEPFTPTEFAQRAQDWKPFRIWATVLIRSTGPQLLATKTDN